MTAPDERLQAALSRLARVRRSGGAYSALCPVHDDHHPSLRVGLNDHGNVWAECKAGCPREAVREALGLPSGVDDGQSAKPAASRASVREYVYQASDGTPVAVKLRWRGRGAKFSWRLPDGRNELHGLDPGLYRRPAVDAAVQAGGVIWLAEGERDADTLAATGLTATTGPHGASTWRPAWSAVLAGADIVVVADRDRRGVKHAMAVAAELAGVGCTVTALVPPPSAKDVTELLEDGGTLHDLEELTEDIVVDTPKIRLTDDGRPAFAMIPHYWTDLLDLCCLKLVVLLDSEQGDDGRPMSGRNNVAKRLGWGSDQTDEHLGHLIAAGIITVTQQGRRQAIYRVHNPSRRRSKKTTSGPSQGSPVDRVTVRSGADSGPPQGSLPSSLGLKKFSGAAVDEGGEREVALIGEAFAGTKRVKR